MSFNQTYPVIDNAEVTIINGQILSTGYSTSDNIKDMSKTIVVDNGSLTLNASYASMSTYKYRIFNNNGNFADALSMTGTTLWIGQGFAYCQLNNFFPQTGGQGEVGNNIRRYGIGYINSIISGAICSSGGLVIGIQEAGGQPTSSVGAAGPTAQVTLRTADNTGTGATGSVFICAGIASGGGVSGNVVINTLTAPAYQSMIGGLFVRNATVEPIAAAIEGSFIWNFTGKTKFSGSIALPFVGSGIEIKEGANATSGLATLTAGSVVVSNTKVTVKSRIQLTTNGGNLTNVGTVYISARTAGTSFTISSLNLSDTSDVAWFIVESI